MPTLHFDASPVVDPELPLRKRPDGTLDVAVADGTIVQVLPRREPSPPKRRHRIVVERTERGRLRWFVETDGERRSCHEPMAEVNVEPVDPRDHL